MVNGDGICFFECHGRQSGECDVTVKATAALVV